MEAGSDDKGEKSKNSNRCRDLPMQRRGSMAAVPIQAGVVVAFRHFHRSCFVYGWRRGGSGDSVSEKERTAHAAIKGNGDQPADPFG